jgi:hypothetical protein
MKGSVLFIACMSLVLGAAVGLFSTQSFRSDNASKIRIGAPDDTGGLVLQAMLLAEEPSHSVLVTNIEPHPFKDCCSSSSQWALSSDDLDGAVMCPNAAAKLIERDGRFQIIGPCVLNSDAYVTQGEGTPGKVGVAHKREYQATIVRRRFGAECGTISMLPSSLPFALARGLVDGIVLDGLKAISIPEPRLVNALSGETIVTYVFVIRKQFHRDPSVSPFVDGYGRTAAALNDPVVLAHWIGRLKGATWKDREIQEWKSLNVQFVSPWTAESRTP